MNLSELTKKQKKAFNFLMGEVMKLSNYMAKPEDIKRILLHKLGMTDDENK